MTAARLPENRLHVATARNTATRTSPASARPYSPGSSSSSPTGQWSLPSTSS